ncbi:Peroxisomal membrane protein 11C, partial [Eumeta japonica]
VVSLVCYALKLWGSSCDRKAVLAASARLAAARASLRLFDDAAALKAARLYGFGKQEGAFWGSLGVSGQLLHLAYLQAEKLVFLIDTGVLNLDPQQAQNCRTLHKALWSASAAVGLVRSLRALNFIIKEVNSGQRRKCASARLLQAALTTTKSGLDVLHAVSWLPAGWLWGSKLTTTQASAAATASAVLALVLHYHGKQLAPVR